MVVSLKANEQVIRAGDSTYFADKDKIEGKLILTNQRIYFKPSNGKGDKYNLEILPAEILEVIFFNTAKIFPNGLNVVKKTGEQLRFKVKHRNEMGALINKMY